MEDAASKFGVSVDRLVAFEQGFEDPTPSMIRSFASVYRMSPAAFFLSGPSDVGFESPTDFRTVDSAGIQPLSPVLRREIDRVRAQVRILKDIAAEGVIRPVFDMSTIRSSDGIEDFAQSIREWLGESATTRLDRLRSAKSLFGFWNQLIEERGVLVTQVSGVPVGEMRGFCIFDRQFPVIVVNGADGHSARLFTLIHELVHIMSGDECVCSGVLGDQNGEAFCNSVAAAVLIPRDRLLSLDIVARSPMKKDWSLSELEAISAPFGASREATLRRLLTLGRTTTEHYREIRALLREQYRQRPSRKDSEGGPLHDVMIVRNLGRPYVEAVIRSHRLGLSTYNEAASRLFEKIQWVDTLADRLGTG